MSTTLPLQPWRARLTAAPVARLATADADGVPHLVPITFAVVGDIVYFAVDDKPKRTTRLRRLRNIASQPRVAVLVDHYDDDWDRLWWIRGDGAAAEVSDAGERERALDALAARYPPYRERRPAGPVVAIRVDRWSWWSAAGLEPERDPPATGG